MLKLCDLSLALCLPAALLLDLPLSVEHVSGNQSAFHVWLARVSTLRLPSYVFVHDVSRYIHQYGASLPGKLSA